MAFTLVANRCIMVIWICCFFHHGLLLEMQHEMEQLSDPKVTHIGVGFAEDSTKVLVVELLSNSPVVVERISPAEDGSIIVDGTNLDPTGAGIYCARIVSSTNDKKVPGLIGPEGISYDKASAKFQLKFEPPQEEVFYAQDPKWLEIFVRRKQIDSINYGHSDGKKIRVEEFEQALRMPMEYVPDPRVVKEDARDAEVQERDAKERAERAEEERMIRLAQQAAKKEEQAKKREAMLAEREKKKGADGDDEDGSDDMSGSERSGSGSKSGVSGTKSSHRKSKSGAGSLGQSASKGGKSFGMGSDEDGSDGELEEDGEDDDEFDGGMGDLPSHPAMKRELI